MRTDRDPLDSLDWPFRTERLTIRRCAAGDLREMWRYRHLAETTRWTPLDPVDVDHWESYMSDPGRLARTLVIEQDGVVVGDLMLTVQDSWAQREVAERARGTMAELGWSLDPARSGQGIATEAVRELIRICFEDLGLRRVIAQAFADNERSWRLMERVGMRRELYTRKDSLHRDLGWLDGVSYGLLAEEWSANDQC
ncbi:GNAT family protein [Myceligenerans crystallogenes]|uniref:GNAT family protein n=1 Tax=Myceligenerans crystallogenes TaxID=316335 RepID=A0ABN2NG23_9MICO